MAKINVVCKNKKNYRVMKEVLDDRGYSFKKDKENLTLTVKKTCKDEMKDLVEAYDIDAKVKKVEKEKEEETPAIPVLDNTQDENPFVENEREDENEDEEKYEDEDEEYEEDEEERD